MALATVVADQPVEALPFPASVTQFPPLEDEIDISGYVFSV